MKHFQSESTGRWHMPGPRGGLLCGLHVAVVPRTGEPNGAMCGACLAKDRRRVRVAMVRKAMRVGGSAVVELMTAWGVCGGTAAGYVREARL